jgi:hypothetical protein
LGITELDPALFPEIVNAPPLFVAGNIAAVDLLEGLVSRVARAAFLVGVSTRLGVPGQILLDLLDPAVKQARGRFLLSSRWRREDEVCFG